MVHIEHAAFTGYKGLSLISEGDLLVTEVMIIPKQSLPSVNSLALDFVFHSFSTHVDVNCKSSNSALF